MKKISRLSVISLTASAILLSANSFAGHADYKHEEYKGEVVPAPIVVPVPVGLKDGAYAGVGLGYDSYKFRESLGLADGGGGIVSFNPTLSAKGWNGSLFAGYGQYYDRFYIAGEVSAFSTDANTGYSFGTGLDNFNTEVNARYGYSVSILPGIKVNNFTLLYARLGFVRTSFKSQEKVIVAGTGLTQNASTTSWGNGYNYGVGMETAVYPCVSVRGEYTYTSYGSFNSPIGTKFSPSNNQFVLSAIYHFA